MPHITVARGPLHHGAEPRSSPPPPRGCSRCKTTSPHPILPAAVRRERASGFDPDCAPGAESRPLRHIPGSRRSDRPVTRRFEMLGSHDGAPSTARAPRGAGRRPRIQAKVNGQFTSADARIRLKRLYPAHDERQDTMAACRRGRGADGSADPDCRFGARPRSARPPPRSDDLRNHWPRGGTVAAFLALACSPSWTSVCKRRAERSPLTVWP